MDDECITREAALEVVNGWREQLLPTYGENDEYVKCLETVAEHLYFIPAADVVEVVRCKDCKHSDTFPADGEVSEMPLKCLGIRYGGVMGDWYCEHGKRRTDDG